MRFRGEKDERRKREDYREAYPRSVNLEGKARLFNAVCRYI